MLEGLAPASPYSPALLTGELSCEQSPPDGAFVLAALNGRAGGSGALQPASSRSGLFAVMAAPSLFLEGANRVELVLAWGPPEAPRLARVD